MSAETSTARSALATLMSHALPRGTGWAQVSGALLLALFVVQLVTGLALALYYSPSSDQAWESIRYIEEQVAAGALVRSLHHWSASAFVVLLVVHVARVFLWAAYKGQRRWTWVVGGLLALCVMGFVFTGQLLPWDLRAYFATRVGVGIAGSVPWIGESLARLLAGGGEIGELTLPRFYSLHVIALPLITSALIAVHVALIRWRGIAPDWRERRDEGVLQYFFPHQVLRDSAAALALVLVLLWISSQFRAPLEARADPTDTTYVPRPEWYFLGAQQLLRVFDGKWEILATAVVPMLGTALFLGVPWLDRGPARHPRERKLALSIFLSVLVASVSLTYAGHAEVQREERRIQSPPASELRTDPSAEPVETSEQAAELTALGAELFMELRCASCHQAAVDSGVFHLPSLAFEGSRAKPDWLERYLQKPTRIRYATDGEHPLMRMPAYGLAPREARALTHWLSRQVDPVRIPDWGVAPTASRGELDHGRNLVEQHQCTMCHVIAGQGNRIGPCLDGVGERRRPDYVFALIRDPQRVIPETPMLDAEISDDEVRAIVHYLLSLPPEGMPE